MFELNTGKKHLALITKPALIIILSLRYFIFHLICVQMPQIIIKYVWISNEIEAKYSHWQWLIKCWCLIHLLRRRDGAACSFYENHYIYALMILLKDEIKTISLIINSKFNVLLDFHDKAAVGHIAKFTTDNFQKPFVQANPVEFLISDSYFAH